MRAKGVLLLSLGWCAGWAGSLGEVLDRLEGEVTATIKVNSVREKISYCELVDGVTPERGATVIFH